MNESKRHVQVQCSEVHWGKFKETILTIGTKLS